jgi:hypothetical protein
MGRLRLAGEGVKKFFERVQIICQLAIGNADVLFSRVAKPETQGEINWQQKI